jgi:hypothetical protein
MSAIVLFIIVLSLIGLYGSARPGKGYALALFGGVLLAAAMYGLGGLMT